MRDAWGQIDELGWHRLRWSAAFLLVAGLFSGAGWFVIHWTPVIAPPPAPPPEAVMINLAPLPAAPPPPPTEMPPGPRQILSEPPPAPAPQAKAIQPTPTALAPVVPPPPMPTTPPAPASSVAIPLPPLLPAQPRAEPHLRVRVHHPPLPHPGRTPAPATIAPPEIQAPSAPAPASAALAPAASQPSSRAVPTWQGKLLGRLERFKRYPLDARYRHEQGVAYLRFSMDRNGRVISASIAKSSGYADLDREALALIQRAQPLPKPPPEVSGDPITLTVPVQFFLRDSN